MLNVSIANLKVRKITRHDIFKKKKFNMCYHRVKVRVELEHPISLAKSIHNLKDDTSTKGVAFKRLHRQLNNALA